MFVRKLSRRLWMSTGDAKGGSGVLRGLERRLPMHAGDFEGGCGCLQET
jgi:hypothetical protein